MRNYHILYSAERDKIKIAPRESIVGEEGALQKSQRI